MTFEIIKGNLFDPTLNFGALAQGVNTKGVMGAGIAVDFKARWPDMFNDYKNLCNSYTDLLPGLLHKYDNIAWNPSDPIGIIFNLFTQDFPGRNNAVLEYVAKSSLLMRMEAEARDIGRVGLPWIGCGIGGLAQHNVGAFFERILGPSVVEFVLVER